MTLEPCNIVCPNCGNGNYMRHLVGDNVGRLDVKCINCNSYFNFWELHDLQKMRASAAEGGNVTGWEPLFPEQRIIAVYVQTLPECCTACNYQYVTDGDDGDLVFGCDFLGPSSETKFPDDFGRRPCCPMKKATKRIKKTAIRCRGRKGIRH